jgi:5-methylcytosine-specific restriction enzyme A
MPKSSRAFRTLASLEAENQSRNLVSPFLRSQGFVVEHEDRPTAGTATSQIITAIDPDGQPIKMRVRLCWRWDDDRKGTGRFSAAQLRARLLDGDWNRTLKVIVSRDVAKSISHSLLIQCQRSRVEYCALIPVTELHAIWKRQREVSSHLIRDGKMGRIKKNHAENGGSPTLWLMDTRTPDAHAVSDVLWNWPGVKELAKQSSASPLHELLVDDTFDDISGIDYAALGSDGAARVMEIRSNVKRDPRVRREVIKRATDGCERPSCTSQQSFPGFLDVHHILGAETSDRYWNCVALCPNCHRAAHFHPERQQINDELLAFATRFKPAES